MGEMTNKATEARAINYMFPTVSTEIYRGYTGEYNAKLHDGIDILPLTPGEPGDQVYAFANGTVALSGYTSSRGNYVVLNHGLINGLYLRTIYLHLQKAPTLKQGQTVSMGDVVGYMGNTGDSYGEHLHFSIRYKTGAQGAFTVGGQYFEGVSTNPKNYFSWIDK